MEPEGATRSQTARRTRWRVAAAAWWQQLGWRGGRLAEAARDNLERELAERAGFNWLAVAFALGCFAYFVLPREPMLAALAAGAALFGLLAARGYRRGGSWRIATLLAVCLAGATAGKIEVEALDGPHVERARAVEWSGRVIDREERAERRPRIVLDELRAATFPAAETPRRIRLTLAAKDGLPPLGARIMVRARTNPVPGPVAPGGYDPRRAAFFEEIGGSGFALGAWRIEEEPPRFSAALAVARIRAAVVARIVAAEPGEAGAVAAALLVGERSTLSEETNESLRVSGLAHILSISGLHMMLIAGTAFFFVRAGLALSPTLALTRPIRKWAALAALLTVTVYLALSGGGSATVRAYVMAAIIFSAILVDRPAISMRNLAIAAFVVLALEPESVVEPGFQMSFAAVAALIAAWTVWTERRRRRLADDDALPGMWLARIVGRAVLGAALTTIIAGLATAPFAAYHFERVATYSLLGNLLAAPLVSLVIMPFGLLTLVTMPFGLEALPLSVMARGIEILLAISDWVAALPGSEARAAGIAPASLLLMTAGLVWLCLWRLRWRLFGVAPIALGLALIPLLADPPDVLVSPDGRAIAVRDESGVLRVSGARAGSYVVEQFFDDERANEPDTAALRSGVACDPLACILSAGGGLLVSHVLDPGAFPEDCRRARVIATPLNAPADCRAAIVVDAERLRRFGAHAIRFGRGEQNPTVTTERGPFPRPWQAGGGELALNISATGP